MLREKMLLLGPPEQTEPTTPTLSVATGVRAQKNDTVVPVTTFSVVFEQVMTGSSMSTTFTVAVHVVVSALLSVAVQERVLLGPAGTRATNGLTKPERIGPNCTPFREHDPLVKVAVAPVNVVLAPVDACALTLRVPVASPALVVIVRLLEAHIFVVTLFRSTALASTVGGGWQDKSETSL